MKYNINTLKKLSALLGFLVILTACERDTSEIAEDPNLLAFRTAFPEFFDKIRFEESSSGLLTPENQGKQTSYIAYPIGDAQEVLGYYVDLGNSAGFVQLGERNKEWVYYDFKNNSSLSAPNSYNADLQRNIPIFEKDRLALTFRGECLDSRASNICAVGCALAAAAIMASDGPAPLMDALAVSYLAACLTECHFTHCEPKDGQ